MKAVLISIQPKWCKKIAIGKKTLEVRKTRPKLPTPFKCYIYCTVSNGKYLQRCKDREKEWYIDREPFFDGVVYGGNVIGEFVCDGIKEFDSKYSEWAYSVAPPGSIMPMHKYTALRVMEKDGCLSMSDINSYFGDKGYKAFFWHISDLKIYGEPMELGKFMKPCETEPLCESCDMFREFENSSGNSALLMKRPPQSWCYVEELEVSH